LICELLALAQQALEPVFTPKLSGGGPRWGCAFDAFAPGPHPGLSPV